METNTTEAVLLAEINSKLDQIVGLLLIAGKETDESVAILQTLGLDSRTIGKLVGLRSDAVRKRLSRAKSKQNAKPR